MRTIVYLRVGKSKDKVKFSADAKPDQFPLKIGDRFIPTIAFGVELDLPDQLFSGAALVVGLLKVNAEEAKIASSIKIPKII